MFDFPVATEPMSRLIGWSGKSLVLWLRKFSKRTLVIMPQAVFQCFQREFRRRDFNHNFRVPLEVDEGRSPPLHPGATSAHFTHAVSLPPI
jgi:hypothetical protein